jgi:hypothetical protein
MRTVSPSSSERATDENPVGRIAEKFTSRSSQTAFALAKMPCRPSSSPYRDVQVHLLNTKAKKGLGYRQAPRFPPYGEKLAGTNHKTDAISLF